MSHSLGGGFSLLFMAGRPLKFTSKEQLQTEVDLYFAQESKPTLAGLALSLGINRQTLYNYAEKDEFLDIIKKARERVEAAYEGRLIYENNPTGVIFALKNMGWKDKTEIDQRIEQVKPFSWFHSQDRIMTTNGQQKES